MVLPVGGIRNEEIQFEQQPGRTWKIDFRKKRIIGMTDELEALKQAVFLILHTERFAHLIYSSDYGAELTGLIGEHQLFLQSELTRRIIEALLQDDRVTGVEDFSFEFAQSDVLVRFAVISLYGSFQEEVEVSMNV